MQVKTKVGNLAGLAPMRFGAQLELSAPATIQQSRFPNQRIPLRTESLVRSLLEKLDEALTVTGEVYSANEAFTTHIDIDVQADRALRRKKILNASLNQQTDHVVGGRGVMVMSIQADDFRSGQPIARGRAIFRAIDAKKLREGKMASASVQQLNLQEGEAPVNSRAVAWNDKLFAFYKEVCDRLKARDPEASIENLAQVPSSPLRLINSNLYVSTDMLNKKQTGHGGITASIAAQDMQALVEKAAGLKDGDAQVMRITANYIGPFQVSDALQMDTTLDHITEEGDFILSSRIYKLDTKQRKSEGPIILVHARLKDGSRFAPLKRWLSPRLHVSQSDPAARQRQAEATAWHKLMAETQG